MIIEAVSTEGISNPLDLDLVGRPDDATLGIINTVGGWTTLHERVIRLQPVITHASDARSRLYQAGYGYAEIAREVGVSRHGVQYSVEGIDRAPLVASLRAVFTETTRGCGMDLAIRILRDFMNGLSPTEVARHTNFRPAFLVNSRLALLAAGFPIPEVRNKPTWGVLDDDSKYGHLSALVSARGLEPFYQSLLEAGFDLVQRERGGGNYYYYPRPQEEALKIVLRELGVLREHSEDQKEDVELDPVLARGILAFVMEGNLESYPWSSIPELCAVLNFYLLHFISSDKLPKIQPGTAKEFYQYFSYGLNKLEVAASDPKIRGRWDEDTKILWNRVQDMKSKYGNKGLLLIRTLNRLEQSERNLVNLSR